MSQCSHRARVMEENFGQRALTATTAERMSVISGRFRRITYPVRLAHEVPHDFHGRYWCRIPDALPRFRLKVTSRVVQYFITRDLHYRLKSQLFSRKKSICELEYLYSPS
ncbi:hypothetical protein APHAL10511_005146 [Amanita phalloides]|nr:hypothetical protein APHAL10511_005146 [Amanita phalloides]